MQGLADCAAIFCLKAQEVAQVAWVLCNKVRIGCSVRHSTFFLDVGFQRIGAIFRAQAADRFGVARRAIVSGVDVNVCIQSAMSIWAFIGWCCRQETHFTRSGFATTL